MNLVHSLEKVLGLQTINVHLLLFFFCPCMFIVYIVNSICKYVNCIFSSTAETSLGFPLYHPHNLVGMNVFSILAAQLFVCLLICVSITFKFHLFMKASSVLGRGASWKEYSCQEKETNFILLNHQISEKKITSFILQETTDEQTT